MSRTDFRSCNQMRPPSCSLGEISEAGGSCHFSQGNTEAIASVYGPTEPKYNRHEKYDKATLEINFSLSGSARTAAAASGGNVIVQRLEKFYAKHIKECLLDCINLDEYPRMIIYIKICILRDDGSMVSVALNAASLALIDSGISMSFIPTSVSIYFPSIKNNEESSLECAGECSLDPTCTEEKNSFSLFIYTTNICANQKNFLNKYDILNLDENMDICKPVHTDKDMYGITHTYATGKG
mmetsp:Transcript_2537/g.2640  ORF Transcript_2537/g.2640 Transcript_2537/m.2640 type:complete len:240 (-) Transcript_2537:3-722(-)